MQHSTLIPAGKPSNRHFWGTCRTAAPPEAVWSIWTDVVNWKSWDLGLRDASLLGPFRTGSRGSVVSLEGITSRFEIRECVSGRTYTLVNQLPLGKLVVKRSLGTQTGQTLFVHEVWFEGLSAPLFSRLFGPKFRRLLPEAMRAIQKQAADYGPA